MLLRKKRSEFTAQGPMAGSYFLRICSDLRRLGRFLRGQGALQTQRSRLALRWAQAENSRSCCGAGLAGAIAGSRSGRPTPFGANRSGLSPRRDDLHGSVMDGQGSAEELVLDDLFWMD